MGLPRILVVKPRTPRSWRAPLRFPAVVGLHDVSVRVGSGDQVLIDGNKGVLIINPTEDQLTHYGEVAKARQNLQTKLSTLREEAATTRDAYSLLLSANYELPTDVEAVQRHGARGVGLFRSEFLYLAVTNSHPKMCKPLPTPTWRGNLPRTRSSFEPSI